MRRRRQRLHPLRRPGTDQLVHQQHRRLARERQPSHGLLNVGGYGSRQHLAAIQGRSAHRVGSDVPQRHLQVPLAGGTRGRDKHDERSLAETKYTPSFPLLNPL